MGIRYRVKWDAPTGPCQRLFACQRDAYQCAANLSHEMPLANVRVVRVRTKPKALPGFVDVLKHDDLIKLQNVDAYWKPAEAKRIARAILRAARETEHG